MKYLKAIIPGLGIVLTIAGWHLNRAERYPSLINFLAPSYVKTLKAYERMLLSSTMDSSSPPPIEITKSDPGFGEILSILVDVFPEIANGEGYVKMRIKSVGLAAGSYNTQTGAFYAGAQPGFDITSKEGKVVTIYVNDLRPEIRKRFLENTVFSWDTRIFWLGIITTSLSGLLFLRGGPQEGSWQPIRRWSNRPWVLFLAILVGFICVPFLFSSDGINNALLWLTGIVVLLYTFESHGLRLEMVRQNEIAIQPVVIAFIEERSGGTVSETRFRPQLILRNVGRGTALFLKVQDLILTDPAGDRVRFMASFAPISCLEPQREEFVQVAKCRSIDTDVPSAHFDPVVSLMQRYALEDYNVVIEYRDTNGGARQTLMQIGNRGINLLKHGKV